MAVQPCNPDQLADPVWERAIGETSKAFDAFMTYLEAGPDRTIASATNHPYASCRDWAKRWRWRERAATFDRHLAAQRREAFADEYIEVGRRHARQAHTALEMIMAPAIVLARKLTNDPLSIHELEMMDLPDLYTLALQSIRLLPQLQQAEMVARGESGDTNTGAHIIDVDEFDDNHMHAVAAALNEIGALPAPAQLANEPESANVE